MSASWQKQDFRRFWGTSISWRINGMPWLKGFEYQTCLLHGGGRLLGSGTQPPPPFPPPLPALRAHLVAKGQQLLAIHMVAPKAPEIFFSFPLPILSTLHPNIILEPNLDSNAHPNPQPTPNTTPKPFP